jgi:hypothetical protein
VRWVAMPRSRTGLDHGTVRPPGREGAGQDGVHQVVGIGSSARRVSRTSPPMTAAWTAVRSGASAVRVSLAIVAPRLAADMIDPELAADINEPKLAAESTEAALDAEPRPSTDVTEPIEPIDAKLPTEAMLSTEPRLAMDRIESSEAMDHFDVMSASLARPPLRAKSPVRVLTIAL